MYKKWVNGVMC